MGFEPSKCKCPVDTCSDPVSTGPTPYEVFPNGNTSATNPIIHPISRQARGRIPAHLTASRRGVAKCAIGLRSANHYGSTVATNPIIHPNRNATATNPIIHPINSRDIHLGVSAVFTSTIFLTESAVSVAPDYPRSAGRFPLRCGPPGRALPRTGF